MAYRLVQIDGSATTARGLTGSLRSARSVISMLRDQPDDRSQAQIRDPADYALLVTRHHTSGVADRHGREVTSRRRGDERLLGPITKATSDEQGRLP